MFGTHVSTIERLTVSRGGNRSRLLTLSIIHGRVSSVDRPIKYFIRDKVVWNVHVCWPIDVTAKCRRRSLKHIVFKRFVISACHSQKRRFFIFIFSTDGLQPFNHSHFVLHLSEIINHYISLTHCILFRFVRCSDCVNRNVTKSVPWLCSVSQLDLFLVTASQTLVQKKKN